MDDLQHLFGNPLFALETDLGTLERRLAALGGGEDDREVIRRMRRSLEKAKGVLKPERRRTGINPVTFKCTEPHTGRPINLTIMRAWIGTKDASPDAAVRHGAGHEPAEHITEKRIVVTVWTGSGQEKDTHMVAVLGTTEDKLIEGLSLLFPNRELWAEVPQADQPGLELMTLMHKLGLMGE